MRKAGEPTYTDVVSPPSLPSLLRFQLCTTWSGKTLWSRFFSQSVGKDIKDRFGVFQYEGIYTQTVLLFPCDSSSGVHVAVFFATFTYVLLPYGFVSVRMHARTTAVSQEECRVTSAVLMIAVFILQ